MPATGGRWQVSTKGGVQPQWRSDGEELYFIAPDKRLMAAEMKVAGSGLEVREPVALVQTRVTGLQGNPHGWQYFATPNGHASSS